MTPKQTLLTVIESFEQQDKLIRDTFAELEMQRREVQRMQNIIDTGRAAHLEDRVRLDELGRYLTTLRSDVATLKTERDACRDQLYEAMCIMKRVLESAQPNPDEHPALSASFNEARTWLADLKN